MVILSWKPYKVLHSLIVCKLCTNTFLFIYLLTKSAPQSWNSKSPCCSKWCQKSFLPFVAGIVPNGSFYLEFWLPTSSNKVRKANNVSLCWLIDPTMVLVYLFDSLQKHYRRTDGRINRPPSHLIMPFLYLISLRYSFQKLLPKNYITQHTK